MTWAVIFVILMYTVLLLIPTLVIGILSANAEKSMETRLWIDRLVRIVGVNTAVYRFDSTSIYIYIN